MFIHIQLLYVAQTFSKIYKILHHSFFYEALQVLHFQIHW